MTKLHDGYLVAEPLALPTIRVEKLFYPAWWLERVGYYGPRFYPCYGPCDGEDTPGAFPGNNGPRTATASAAIDAQPQQSATISALSTSAAAASSASASAAPAPPSLLTAAALAALVAGVFAAGVHVGSRRARAAQYGAWPVAKEAEAEAYVAWEERHGRP